MMKTQHYQAQILHICPLASFIQTLLENFKNKQLGSPFLKMVTNKSNNKLILKYLKYTQESEHSWKINAVAYHGKSILMSTNY